MTDGAFESEDLPRRIIGVSSFFRKKKELTPIVCFLAIATAWAPNDQAPARFAGKGAAFRRFSCSPRLRRGVQYKSTYQYIKLSGGRGKVVKMISGKSWRGGKQCTRCGSTAHTSTGSPSGRAPAEGRTPRPEGDEDLLYLIYHHVLI